MNISDYLRTALLNHVMDVAVFTPPNTVWGALYSAPPTSAGGGTEFSAVDYQRVAISWGAAVLGDITNNADIKFPASGTAASSWGNATTLCLFDSPTNGNLLFFGPLSAPIVLGLGSFFVISAADLSITLH